MASNIAMKVPGIWICFVVHLHLVCQWWRCTVSSHMHADSSVLMAVTHFWMKLWNINVFEFSKFYITLPWAFGILGASLQISLSWEGRASQPPLYYLSPTGRRRLARPMLRPTAAPVTPLGMTSSHLPGGNCRSLACTSHASCIWGGGSQCWGTYVWKAGGVPTWYGTALCRQPGEVLRM